MKPTQQQIEEARTVYDLFWDSYQKGDVGSFATTLDDHFEMIGTSETERCHSKAEGIEFFKSQTEEVVGKAEMRNRQIHAIPVESMVLVNEQCDIYVLAETDWNFYSIIRISTFLRETSDGWKVVQQHGSFPDMRVQEGETLAIDKISRENVELRDAVKRRTAELENKNRELEIEASLERVRARSMAMQKSDELHDVLSVLFDQFYHLGIEPVNVFLSLFSREDKTLTYRATGTGGSRTQGQQVVSLDSLDVWKELFEKWKNDNSDSVEVIYYEKEILPTLFGLLEETFAAMPEKERLSIEHFPDGGYTAHGYTPFGYIGFNHTRKPTEEEKEILTKFASEFSRVYQRFLDIERAEAQVRESEIQLALERVRAKGLAMHSTEEIESATAVVFNELSRLGIDMERCGITIMNETPIAELWSTTLSRETKEVIDIVTGVLDFRMHPLTQQSYRDWQEKKEFSTYHLVGDDLKKYYGKLEKQPGYSFPKVDNYPEKQVLHTFFFEEGAIFVYTTSELSIESKKIVRRFTNVFEQTYTRFLDLQKAEKQAREAQIEAALERIRSKAIAMQNTDDIADTVITFFEELLGLGLDKTMRAGIGILSQEERMKFWTASAPDDSEIILHNGFLEMYRHQLLKGAKKAWVEGDSHFDYVLAGEDVNNYYQTLNEAPYFPAEFDLQKLPETVYHRSYIFKDGLLYTFTETELPEDISKILERFAAVFGQTYTRFLDLQKAEKLAFESARQASLDRIRAEIASMRSAEDLQQITPIIWDELKKMAIPFIRCGVFIIDEEKELSHTYLSTSQGDPIAALHLPVEGIPLIKNLKNSWDNGEIYTIHWNEDDFSEWTQNLINKGFIDSKEKYEAGSAPKKLDLHFLPFKHGMLYIGNIEPLSSESLDLGQSMAKALSVAYDRYEDFNKLEQAKTKVENALSSLESAQKQLVQQEKLASLGQLTAGIAHEIKNPLNFINNFSDLSVDLVNEIREELRFANAGNELRQEDINDILNDLETNLKTIYKHGTRTDTIVKSMLEHSRGGSGVMEPNNVNELLTEFGNLSYHGMRAGKEPMQVEMVYELDDTIEDIPIVAEDFSRVIVNLCYNSFDAMRSKENDMKEKGEEFDPKLILRTRLRDNNILIEIEDNGSGIPDEIRDKILQPFFTTKKGTAGTGLGLSITNEIISAHGGSLQIDSEKDTFTRFSIVLPKT